MATPQNPKTATWVNPTEATDQNGNQVAWSAATDLAGIELSLDGAAVVSVPVALGATSFDLTTLAAYQALATGSHTLDIALTTKEGAVSPMSNTATFLVAPIPLAPTGLVVA